MRLVLTYVFVLALGGITAAGAAWLAGLAFPFLRLPVFVLIALWWLAVGRRYAAMRDARLGYRPHD